MPGENINQEFRLKKIDEIRNHLIEEINRNILNYINHSLFVISTITGCVSISALLL